MLKLLNNLYKKVINLASHKFAERYLVLLCFFESCFFPVPPDVMLMPMVIAKPHTAKRLIIIAVLASVLGGAFGYILGWLAFEPIIKPFLEFMNYLDTYNIALNWFNKFGFFAIILAGFTPIPYKLFTIGSGALHYPIIYFIIASIIGRSLRYGLVCGVTKFGKKNYLQYFNKKLS